jgi:hypothetical protein
MNKNYTRRELLSRLAFVPAVLAVPVDLLAKPQTKGFVSLFDGKSLAGWHTNPQRITHGTGGLWRVEDGVLKCEQDPPGSGNGGMLMSDKKYGDFELEVDVLPDWGIDSGIFIRTNEKGECFQIYVDHLENGLIAFISTENKEQMYRMHLQPFNFEGVLDSKGKLTDFKMNPKVLNPDYLLYHCSPEKWKKAWKIGKWNTIRIRCTGKYPRITTWINNVMIADFDGETCTHPRYHKEMLAENLGREGHVAFQVHSGKVRWKEGNICRWKNIRIKELQ